MYTNLRSRIFFITSSWLLHTPLHAMMQILTKELPAPINHTCSTQPIEQDALVELLQKRLSPSRSDFKENFSIAPTDSPATGNINSLLYEDGQSNSVSPAKELPTPPLYPARSLNKEESAVPLPPPALSRSRASTNPEQRVRLFSSYLHRASTELLPSPRNQQEIALVLLKKVPHRKLSASNTILAALAQDNLDRSVLSFQKGEIEQSRKYLNPVLEQKENELAKHHAATLNYKLSLKETEGKILQAKIAVAIAQNKAFIARQEKEKKERARKNKCLPWF